MAESEEKFAGWAILELMGHRRLGGFVQEATLAGGAFLRIDVPGDADGEVHSTQFYSPGSVYCLTPVTEEAAKIVARSSRPAPVHTWELPAPTPRRWPICSKCEERHDPDEDCSGIEDDLREDDLADLPI
jgi:hypothetical protein